MNKHVFFTLALALAAASSSSIAADSEEAPNMTLALHDGSQAKLLQPVALDKQTAQAAEQRVHIAVNALNDKLSKRLEAKFTEGLRVTSR